MKGSVIGQEGRGFGAGDFAEDFFEGISWDGGVQATEGITEAACEEDILEGLPLGSGLAGGDAGAEDGHVAERSEPREGGFFYDGFCECQLDLG